MESPSSGLVTMISRFFLVSLITAGTGLKRYRDIQLDTGMPDEETEPEEEIADEVEVDDEVITMDEEPEEETAPVTEESEETTEEE